MRLYFIFIFLLILQGLRAQESAPGFMISCDVNEYASTVNFAKRLKNTKNQVVSKSQFEIEYIDVPNESKIIIKDAFNYWQSLLISLPKIKVRVSWESLAANVLATTGSEKVFKNFNNAPKTNVWYPAALAVSIAGKPLNTKEPDITIKVNKASNWSLSPNREVNIGEYDLFTVILHEVAHGVGFVSSFSQNENGLVSWGIKNNPFVFDTFLEDSQGNPIISNRYYTNGSAELNQAITQQDVYFKLDNDIYPGLRIPIYAPHKYSEGGSLSHFKPDHEQIFSTEDQLMFPQLSSGKGIQSAGEGILAVLYTLGWSINQPGLERLYSLPEGVNPIRIYPNPTEEFIFLDHFGDSKKEVLNYSVYDLNGRVLKEGTLTESKTFLDIHKLPSGIYILQLDGFSQRIFKR